MLMETKGSGVGALWQSVPHGAASGKLSSAMLGLVRSHHAYPKCSYAVCDCACPAVPARDPCRLLLLWGSGHQHPALGPTLLDLARTELMAKGRKRLHNAARLILAIYQRRELGNVDVSAQTARYKIVNSTLPICPFPLPSLQYLPKETHLLPKAETGRN